MEGDLTQLRLPASSRLSPPLQAPSADLTVSAANSVWLRESYGLQPAYVAALERYFGAGAARRLASAAAVNSWVSEATHEKITEIVDDSAVEQVGGGAARSCSPRLCRRAGFGQPAQRCADLGLLLTSSRDPRPSPPQAVLVLVNAVYFKGLWEHQFKK